MINIFSRAWPPNSVCCQLILQLPENVFLFYQSMSKAGGDENASASILCVLLAKMIDFCCLFFWRRLYKHSCCVSCRLSTKWHNLPKLGALVESRDSLLRATSFVGNLFLSLSLVKLSFSSSGHTYLTSISDKRASSGSVFFVSLLCFQRQHACKFRQHQRCEKMSRDMRRANNTTYATWCYLPSWLNSAGGRTLDAKYCSAKSVWRKK